MSKKVTRLYGQFMPSHYDLTLEISEDKKTFSGSVAIRGDRKSKPSKRITLHQKNLKISNLQITHFDKKGTKTAIPITRTVLHATYDELRLHTDQIIYSGAYEISMQFSGVITENMEGIYPSNFEIEKEAKQLIATQFESHHAREAFPCIDEPEAKATFQLKLVHSSKELALSNTPAITTDTAGDRSTTTFNTTPIMSTYLLAFVVGDLAYKEAKSKNGVIIRTYATQNQIDHSSFALDVAVKCMDFYEEYYDIKFPLPKCDFVALPDFASGAMENWGLITFREQALLCEEDNTSLSAKQWVALVVAHELTHQWFGNLVTMRWWTDLWLNEGFASWMEYLAIDTLFPEWQLWSQFNVDEQQLALKLDALEHTHPIEVTVNHPDEIRTIFDAISYQKGASIIHMLHTYLGPETFRKGISHYLKTHAYKNTDTIDLWQAFETTSNLPVTTFMGAWTSQSGFPIVRVEEKDDHVIFEQQRFITNPESKQHTDTTLWPIPLAITQDSQLTITKKRTVLQNKNLPDNWTKLNIGQSGFYRVDYADNIQKRQIEAIKADQLSATDRMALIADGFEVTKAGYQSVTEYLKLLEYYADETSLSVWDNIAGSISTIRATLSEGDTDEKLREAIKPYIQKLVRKQLDRLGWDMSPNEDHLDTLLRPIIISLAASADEASILEKIKTSYADKISKGTHLNPDLRSIVYGTTARLGGQKEFDEMLSLYKASSSSDEKLSLTGALTGFKQPVIHQQALDLIQTKTVRLQDVSYWVAYSLSNRHNKLTSWNWVKDNWLWLKKMIGSDLSFSRTPVYVARSFSTQEEKQMYIDFFEPLLEPMLERSYRQGLEIIETQIAWRNRDSQAALTYFSKAE